MIIQIFIALVIVVIGILAWRFLQWKTRLLRHLNKHSFIARTTLGPIEYQIYGSRGEFVLFFHGSPGGYDQYANHRNGFFDNFRVISISRFGYLRTPIASRANLPDQADAIAAFLDEMKLQRVTVFAGSGGGPLALAFAAYHPARVKRLVLFAVASQAQTLDSNRPGVKLLKAITRSDILCWLLFVPLQRKPEKLVAMLIKDEKNRKAIIDKGLAKQFAQSVSVTLPPSLRNPGMENDERILRNLDIPKEKITAPTLIIHGDKDQHVAYQQSELLAKQITGSRLITIKGGDHFLGYLHNEFLNKVYSEFFVETDEYRALG